MKRISILLMLLTLSVASFATSTPTNDKEKAPVKEGVRGDIAGPSHDLSAVGPQETANVEASIQASNNFNATVGKKGYSVQKIDAEGYANIQVERKRVRKVKETKVKTLKHKRTKVKRERSKKPRGKHAGGGILGLLAFVFGLLGFLFGWFLWPVGLLFGLTAIVLGALGLGGERRGLALAGLILGILTIVLPVLIVALLIAAFA